MAKIDLSELSADKLTALIAEAQTLVHERKKTEAAKAKKALKTSGELDTLKAEWQSLGKAGKKLAKTFSFDLVIPIHFTLRTEGPFTDEDCGFYSTDVDAEDLFNHSLSAVIPSEGHKLTRKQRAVLASTVRDYAENACDDLPELLPEEYVESIESFAKDVSTFLKKIEKLGISTVDLMK